MSLFGWFALHPPCVRHTVIVNLRDDPTSSIRGVLWSRWGTWFVLKQASLLHPPDAPEPLPNEAIVHRDNVSFLQVLD